MEFFFPDGVSNPCLLHWWEGSLPLNPPQQPFSSQMWRGSSSQELDQKVPQVYSHPVPAWSPHLSSVQSFSRVCDPMDCSMPGLPVHHQLPEFAQTHVHRVGDAMQPSHPLSSPSPPAFNLSQHQGLFKRVSASHQVAKGLELQHKYACIPSLLDFLPI